MFDFKVKPDDADEYKVTVDSRDVLLWERTTKGRSLRSFQEDPHMADLYKLAFLASKRAGLFDGTQPEFEESCTVDQVDDEDDEDDAESPT